VRRLQFPFFFLFFSIVGLGAALLSGAPYVGMQMTLYEMGKNGVRAFWPRDSLVPLFVVNMWVGALSGVVAQTIFYPGDTLRRRMQTNGIGGERRIYNSTWDCAKVCKFSICYCFYSHIPPCQKIVVREGLMKGFFGGCWANAVKAVPGAALQFACFDYFKALLTK
jgi:solute carrier family 25 phosphate transporter 23/24/25/41